MAKKKHVRTWPGADTREACRKLRERLQLTQQEFAHKTGWAISTVVRYELTRAPKGKALQTFWKLAATHRFDDLEGAFKVAILREEGLAKVPSEFILKIERSHPFLPIVGAVLDLLVGPASDPVRQKLLSVVDEHKKRCEKEK